MKWGMEAFGIVIPSWACRLLGLGAMRAETRETGRTDRGYPIRELTGRQRHELYGVIPLPWMRSLWPRPWYGDGQDGA